MVSMRGTMQTNRLHGIPKRGGKNKDDSGRINITFRKALVKAGTENYYNYLHVGDSATGNWGFWIVKSGVRKESNSNSLYSSPILKQSYNKVFMRLEVYRRWCHYHRTIKIMWSDKSTVTCKIGFVPFRLKKF